MTFVTHDVARISSGVDTMSMPGTYAMDGDKMIGINNNVTVTPNTPDNKPIINVSAEKIDDTIIVF